MPELTEAANRPPIDVIVPVHGAGHVFARCAASLSAHVAPGRDRVIVVVDGPEDAAIAGALENLAAAGIDLRIERQPEALGFVRSVNRGMQLSSSDRDVVLLNSDTQVVAGWLDRLAAAAASDSRIATVTPFSNHATICSLPRFLAENTVPAGYDVDTFAALVALASVREYPRLPTGVGACLLITRRALREIGLFDESFGVGYGEEIDFCLRASANGYEHVLDDATFIYHEGSRSFGTRRAARMRHAHRLIRSRYPAYWRTLSDFIARDPLAAARARVRERMRPERRRRRRRGGGRTVVHVVHGWPPWAHGGTEMYAYRLAMAQRDLDEVTVYARIADPDRLLGEAIEHDAGGVRVRLVVNNFIQRNPLCRSGFHCRRLTADFAALLDEVRPDVVHVHHLAGHCASLMGVAAQRQVPIVYQVQDWWPLCARANFIDRHGQPCTGPTPTKCARCLPITGLPGATITNPLLYAARVRWLRRQLSYAAAFVMGSHFIADNYEQSHILPVAAPRYVLPYGVPTPQFTSAAATPHALATGALATGVRSTDARSTDALATDALATDALATDALATDAARPQAAAARRALRFGYIGALLPHKGVHVAIEAFGAIDREAAELHVWGGGDDPEYRRRLEAAQRPGVTWHGPFPEAAKGDIFASLDAVIVPSIGLESFGIVAYEAMAYGVPVLASRLGALAEVPRAQLFEAGDAAALSRLVARAIGDPMVLQQWRAAAASARQQLVTVEEHAAAIDRIYDEVISRQVR